MPEKVKSAQDAGQLSSCTETTLELYSLKTETTVDQSRGMKQANGPQSEASGEIRYNVAELTEHGQRMIVAHGGEGGLGNVCCPNVSMKPKTTKYEVQRDNSLETEEHCRCWPCGDAQCGKSTLLGAISRVKPAIGHYAFTTLRPNLGNLNFDDFSITVADIPGLIKGANQNRGLGHAFLRHIERTKLEHHQEGLSNRPSLVVANKIDENGAEEVFEELERKVQGVSIYPVCAVLEEGISELKAGLRMLVNGDEKSNSLSIENISVD
ncbi:hypothetical protein DITRI_Ditri05aG0045000 [Diplodiscus trichospermus]